MSSPPRARALGDTPQLESVGRAPRSLRHILPFNIADAYLFEFTLESSLRGIMWFAGLLAAFAVMTVVKKMMDNRIAGFGVVQVFLLSMPRLILFTMPMSLLYGCVQTFTDLSSRGEATALGVGGMSLPRMMKSPLLFGLLLTVLAFALQETGVPWAEQKRLDVLQRQVLQTVGVQSPFNFETKGDDGSRRTIHAKSLDFRSRTMTNVVVQVFNTDGTLSTELQAAHAVWDIQTGKWETPELYSKRLQPSPVFGEPASGENQYISGKTHNVTVNYIPDPNQLGKGAKNLKQNLEDHNYEMVSMSELAAYRAEVQSHHPLTTAARQEQTAAINSTTYGIHDKIATPLICLALVLVGCPLGVHPQRAGEKSQAMGMGYSLMVILVYYIVWTWMSSLGKAGLPLPLLLAYLPLLITAGSGVFLLRQKTI